VLLFDLYSVYQHFQIHAARRQLTARDELFRVISESAVDMIAVVDADGMQIYTSLAQERVLGYSAEELKLTSALEQVHPDDRGRLVHARQQARDWGYSDRWNAGCAIRTGAGASS
jgi:PAS domain S-box-containing protein